MARFKPAWQAFKDGDDEPALESVRAQVGGTG